MKKLTAILCAALCLVLAGCTVREKTTEITEPTAAPTVYATPEPVMIALATASPTATPAPTPEPTPEPTATPEPTPEPTPTPKPFDETWLPKKAPKKDGQLAVVVYFGTQSAEVFEARDGEWVPIRLMRCSTGKSTPTGTFSVGQKYDYHKLFGAYGQWCSRITGHFLFHSVPIDENARKQSSGVHRMKLDEYDKLGTPASDGCIRLCCADAKWVHDNCDKTTMVVLTKDSGPEPPVLPELIRDAPYIVEAGYGWDPTDPDPENPYLAVYGVYEGVQG